MSAGGLRGGNEVRRVEGLSATWSWLSYVAMVLGGLVVLNCLIVVVFVVLNRSEHERADG